MDPTSRFVRVSLREAFWTWCRIAALSFGGPAGQIAVMHRILVDEKKWISEERFLHALNYCMLLPGPEAQQLATYVGWLMHRTVGGLMAGILFVLPGFVSILILSIIYTSYEDSLLVQAMFFGLKPAVMAIVLEAVMRIGKRVLKNSIMIALAVSSFIAIFFLNVPFPVLIIAASLIGVVGDRIAPRWFRENPPDAERTDEKTTERNPEAVLADIPPSLYRSLKISVVCLSLWFGPLIVIRLLLGPESIFLQQGILFSEAAVMTFGGAYSVLAYIAQQAVEQYGWLQPNEMMDGLGMAETTPGPLIMVVQFVGFMGAYRNPGPFDPLVAGIIGSVITTWVTFVPCFYWIFLGAPSIESLRGNQLVRSALSCISAVVIGAILSLATWFSLHTLFRQVETRHAGGFRLLVPDWSSIDFVTCSIALVSLLLTFYWKKGMAVTLAAAVILGLISTWIAR